MSEDQKAAITPLTKEVFPAAIAKRRSSWLPALVLFASFLAGFVPMWMKSSRLGAELLRDRNEARFAQIRIVFADAALDARRGDYEPARQGMAIFFQLASAEFDRGTKTAIPPAVAAELKRLLAQRDDLITLLARGDPASAERLAGAHASFRRALIK